MKMVNNSKKIHGVPSPHIVNRLPLSIIVTLEMEEKIRSLI